MVNLKLYWPKAKYEADDEQSEYIENHDTSSIHQLWTDEPCTYENAARDIIDNWSKLYNVIEAKIDVIDEYGDHYDTISVK